MVWVSTYFGPTYWKIDPAMHMGWWADNRWNSELYYDDDYYVVLSKVGTWTNNYRPTKSRITFTTASGNPVDNITFHVLDRLWEKLGSSDFDPPYNSGDEIDLTFSGGTSRDIEYLVVGKGYRNYLTKIEFWEV
jgi:hypothetical protein